MVAKVTPTDVERRFGEDEIIVSKTDLKGRITYANDIFLRVAQYGEAQLLGQPHSIIRHPDMPRCVFKLLWDTIEKGGEIFAYVKNMAADGAFYWVFAHVTPSVNDHGEIIGYHSNRRLPSRAAIADIEPVYKGLLAAEADHANAKEGMNAGTARLLSLLEEAGLSYDEFVFSLGEGAREPA